jgi:hypothetical protein
MVEDVDSVADWLDDEILTDLPEPTRVMAPVRRKMSCTRSSTGRCG